jgi:hypothetical protein
MISAAAVTASHLGRKASLCPPADPDPVRVRAQAAVADVYDDLWERP